MYDASARSTLESDRAEIISLFRIPSYLSGIYPIIRIQLPVATGQIKQDAHSLLERKLRERTDGQMDGGTDKMKHFPILGIQDVADRWFLIFGFAWLIFQRFTRYASRTRPDKTPMYRPETSSRVLALSVPTSELPSKRLRSTRRHSAVDSGTTRLSH